MSKIHLAALLPDEITEKLHLLKQFRGKQIFQWVQKGINNFERMTNVPNPIKTLLNEQTILSTSKVEACYREEGVSIKLRIRLLDGHTIESVLLIDTQGRKTACLSSQAGCPMKCMFCKTADMGFKRNLESHEIVEQFHILSSLSGDISHIVFMGMGEPLLNLKEVRKAIDVLHHPEGRNIGLRKITISTCGIISGIEDMTCNGPAVRLAVSLVTADDDIRKKLMPVSCTNTLKQLKQTLLAYQDRTGKWITFEIVLLAGITDREEDINKLIAFIPPLRASVNIIPWNPAHGLPYKRPDGTRIKWFRERLAASGIVVTQRYQKGNSINAACGQLFVDEPGE
ncbi:MAG: 23S rRNA (adenine(2503)-C(2))-methyltransferase RlmN [Spirochaetales bacterium]|nr:23S rRNA (adenine(2503)-C(2))-methyltransferase RlmN [Spirochaetales bacterium]